MEENAELSQSLKLGDAFNLILTQKFGHLRAPEPIVTPTGIIHLDALLGGGIISSGPVLVSSTPETGKSTFAYQFSSIFLNHHKSGAVVYLDIESCSNIKSDKYRISRIETFGLNNSRFKYEPVVLDIFQVFNVVEELINIKKLFESKTGNEFFIMIVWDSIASTRCSKTDDAESPDKIIGVKARQLSFCLDKYVPLLKFNKITFVCIDQIRADLKIEGPYVSNEKSVGTFKNVKSATNIYSLQHNVQQWIFLSKKQEITATDGMEGVEGWYVDIFTEKNKLCPSKYWVTCVFDKNNGLDKFWSEFQFLYDVTPSEKKVYKKGPLPFPLLMKQSGSYCFLEVFDPNDENVTYKSDKFYRKDAKHKYNSDPIFKQWFDYAVQISSHYRIVKGVFNQNVEDINIDIDPNINPEIEESLV